MGAVGHSLPLRGYPGDTTVTKPAHRVRTPALCEAVQRTHDGRAVGARRRDHVRMYSFSERSEIAHCLAVALLAGAWSEPEMVGRADLALDASLRWTPRVVREVLASYHRPPGDRPRELAAFIELALDRRQTPKGEERPPRPQRWLAPEPAMGRRRWPVPELASTGALAEFLELSPGPLAWLADARSLERVAADERLRNYRYSVVPRSSGLARVIERPKPRLKAIQRRVLHEILDWIPAHEAAHGFTRGRSALTHARLHIGQDVVLSLDLEDFFASIAAGRVYGIFRTAGYPESVAHALTALSTNVAPPDVWLEVPTPREPALIDARFRLGRRLAQPHLPQGAPSSPALANLAAYSLDRRITRRATSFGATYSRYADDITLSGSAHVRRRADELRTTIGEIAREEGFSLNDRKSRLLTRAGRQQICGIVVNERTNISRTEYDTLRATLHNARRFGPGAQNRAGVADFRAHLLGRIAWVEHVHPTHGVKLRRAFAQVVWQ
jgi:RNA-directed DNA polymerase